MPTSFPTTVWTLNPQDETNDGASDNTVAQAHDYNLAAQEIGALETELGVSAVVGGTLRGTAASLLARLAISLNADGSYKAAIVQLNTGSVQAITSTQNTALISDVDSSGTPVANGGTLPAAVAGLYYFAIVSGSGIGMRITATNGAKIRMGGRLGALNGYIESTDAGANVMLVAVSATLWVAIGPNGIWNLDGA